MVAPKHSAVNPLIRRTHGAVLRPGIVGFCRATGYSRSHVTEVLDGRRDASPRLTKLLAYYHITKRSPINGLQPEDESFVRP